MTTTTKSSLLRVILHALGDFRVTLPILMATLTMHSMEKTNPHRIDTIQNHSSYNNHTLELTGEIQLRDNAIIGYGCEKCINDLTCANITANQQWPLVSVNVFIKNPQEEPHAEQTYTDWTIQMPPVIAAAINKFAVNQIQREEERIASLYGYRLTPENEKIWSDFYYLSAIIDRRATQNKSLVIPAVIPVNTLLSSAITINIFNSCQTSLTFNQHEELEKLMRNFHNAPRATFTTLHPDTTLKIQHAQFLAQPNNNTLYLDERLNDLNEKIYLDLFSQTNTTNQTLEEKNILKRQDAWVLSRDLHLVSPTIGMSLIQDYKHGKNGYSPDTFRSLLVKNELKGKNPVTYTNNRAITGITKQTLSCINRTMQPTNIL